MKKVILIIVLILGITLLWLDSIKKIINKFLNPLNERQNTIATLVESKNNVQLKPFDSFDWTTINKGTRLCQLDTISTNNKSEALVEFDNGSLLQITENSLIVIKNPENKNITELSLDEGILQVKNTKDSNVTIVKTGNLTTIAKGKAVFGIRVKDKQANVWVTKGQATVSDKEGNKVVVKENEQKAFLTNKPIQIQKEEDEEEITKPRHIMSFSSKHSKTLSISTIRRIIARQRNKIDRCYQRRGILNVQGIISAKFVIKSNGRISKVKILQSTVNSPIVEKCVKTWIKATKFPRFTDKKQITETIRFVFN